MFSSFLNATLTEAARMIEQAAAAALAETQRRARNMAYGARHPSTVLATGAALFLGAFNIVRGGDVAVYPLSVMGRDGEILGGTYCPPSSSSSSESSSYYSTTQPVCDAAVSLANTLIARCNFTRAQNEPSNFVIQNMAWDPEGVFFGVINPNSTDVCQLLNSTLTCITQQLQMYTTLESGACDEHPQLPIHPSSPGLSTGVNVAIYLTPVYIIVLGGLIFAARECLDARRSKPGEHSLHLLAEKNRRQGYGAIGAPFAAASSLNTAPGDQQVMSVVPADQSVIPVITVIAPDHPSAASLNAAPGDGATDDAKSRRRTASRVRFFDEVPNGNSDAPSAGAPTGTIAAPIASTEAQATMTPLGSELVSPDAGATVEPELPGAGGYSFV